MSEAPFLTKSGVEVRLDALHLTHTYSGHLEGSKASISRYERGRTPDRVSEQMPPGKPLVVLDPGEDELPRLRWTARLWSHRSFGRYAGDPDFGSELFVCWFSDDFRDDLSARLEAVVQQIDWEGQAGEWCVLQ